MLKSALAAQNVTVSFGERFQASAQFDGVFKQGMALVERTAAYLEGPGRVEAKRLPAAVNVLYASESMRLTTRLLDMASWLLIRRALKEGDISETEAQKKRKGVALQAPSRSSHVAGFGELPEGLRGLVERELRAAGPHHPARPRHEHQVGRRQRRLAAGARQSGRLADRSPARRLRSLRPNGVNEC